MGQCQGIRPDGTTEDVYVADAAESFRHVAVSTSPFSLKSSAEFMPSADEMFSPNTLLSAAYRLEPNAIFDVVLKTRPAFTEALDAVYAAIRGFRESASSNEKGLTGTLAALVQVFGVECLLEADDEGRCALHWVAAQDSPRVLEFVISLLERSAPGFDIDVCDGSGCTPLHYAALKGDQECISILLGRKANAHMANHVGIAPADYFGLVTTKSRHLSPGGR
jgi:ankyrin repeat protein